jgi:glycerophosphoryl diester phosphodiesterase
MTYLDGAKFYVLAHRGGASGLLQENSIEAFRQAIALGCRYLETDVRLAKDGKLYLTHSATSLLPNQLLRSHKNLVTLEELFDEFSDAYFAIDPKHSLAIAPLADLIVKVDAIDRVCIGASFDGRAEKVAQLVESASGVRPQTALVSASSSAKLLLGSGEIQDKGKASFIHMHAKLIRPFVIQRAHAQRLKVIAWVVNDAATMVRLKAWGVDGFMTDCPKIAKDLQLL